MGVMSSIFGGGYSGMMPSGSTGFHWVGPKSTAGINVSESSAMSASAVFASVRAIAEDVAKLPLVLYRRRGDSPKDGKDKARDHVLYDLLKSEPNPEMTSFDARQAIAASAILYGRGFAEIETDARGRPIALWPVHPRLVMVDRREDLSLVYRVMRTPTLLSGRPGMNDTGAVVDVDRTEMIHINGFGDNGVLGAMIARVGSESIGLALAAERFGASFFGNGGAHSGILRHPQTLSKEAQQRLAESYQEKFGGVGADELFRVLVLEEGMDYQRISSNPEEAQATETRQFQVEEVSRWFRTSPHKIGDRARAQGWSTLEMTNQEHHSDTIMPWLIRHEQEFERKLLTPSERRQYVIEHNTDAILRTDALTRARVNQIKFLNGALTQDEWRGMDNQNPLPEGMGGRFYVGRSLIPVDQIGEAASGGGGGPPANRVPDEGNGASSVSRAAKAVMHSAVVVSDGIVRKQCNAYQRAAKKTYGESDEREQLQEWAQQFGDDNQAALAEALSAPAKSMAEMVLGPDAMTPCVLSEITQVAEKVATEYFSACCEDVGDDMAGAAVKWQRESSAVLAEAITTETQTMLELKGEADGDSDPR